MTVTASSYERKKNELYETEPWAVEALCRHINFSRSFIWEPAAGNHKIADYLTSLGSIVHTSDIVTYEREHGEIYDFLNEPINPPRNEIVSIITNPPYGKGNRLAVKFAEIALARCDGFVALLLTAKFDFGKTRRHLFADNPRFAMKIALLDRISWEGNGQTGTEDHAWYIWGPASASPHTPRMAWEGKDASAN